jgi:hypothetical protein
MTWTPQGEARRYAEDCGGAFGLHQRFSVPVAAALWCAVPPDKIEQILSSATLVGRAIFRDSTIPCLEPKCRAIHAAIENGQLPVYRENGGAVSDHVAPERRHVSRDEFKAWIAENYPGERPPGLFDDIERAQSGITADAYLAMKADRDAARADLSRAEHRVSDFMLKHEALKAERDALLGERDSLRAMVDRMMADKGEPPPKARNTLYRIIAALLDLPRIDPEAEYTVIHKDINNRLELFGVRPIAKADTVAEVIKAARALIDEEREPD